MDAKTSGDSVLVALPSSVQTWRIFFRSQDTRNKLNSLNETGAGTPTPYVDISIGTASGMFDAGKIEQTTLADALQIAAGVLGIKSRSITAAMVKEFTLTGGEIADLAISRSAIIGTGIILEAHIGDLQVTSGKIASLQVDKISGWSGATIAVTASLRIEGVSGVDGSISADVGGFETLFSDVAKVGELWIQNGADRHAPFRRGLSGAYTITVDPAAASPYSFVLTFDEGVIVAATWPY
jgi:hypothetical protein